MQEVLKFNLTREEIPVVLVDKDGVERKYVLREMLGRDRDAYLTQMSKKMKFNDKGKVCGISSFDGLNAQLLSRCLYDENDEAVDIETIQDLPSRVQSDLFKTAQKMNALDEEGKEEVKNASEENE